MKKYILLSLLMIPLLWACQDKQTITPIKDRGGIPVNFYSSRQVFNGDTVRLEDGRLATILCRCDTIILSENRPIVITGSSTVFNWNLNTYFPGYDIVKYAKGGYHFGQMRNEYPWDSLLALRPKQWIIQGGDNDILYSRPTNDIKKDLVWMVNKILTAVPDCRIDWMKIKPTQPNFNKITTISGVKYNGLTLSEWVNGDMSKWFAQNYPNSVFPVETYLPYVLYNPKRLNAPLYGSDTVHWNAAGYKVASDLIRPRLLK